MVPEPTTTEWVMAAVAALLVVFAGGLLLILPALRPAATVASRLAGLLIAALGVAMLVIVAVLIGAGIQASGLDPAQLPDDRPDGPFSEYLINRNPETTERVAVYAAVVLVPLAAVLGVLALAAVDVGRSIGLRAIGGLVCGVLLVTSLLVIAGDTGELASHAALGVGLLAFGAVVALAVDEVTARRVTR